jgi:hypothetical protein
VTGPDADGFVNRFVHWRAQSGLRPRSDRRAFALRNSRVRPTLR